MEPWQQRCPQRRELSLQVRMAMQLVADDDVMSNQHDLSICSPAAHRDGPWVVDWLISFSRSVRRLRQHTDCCLRVSKQLTRAAKCCIISTRIACTGAAPEP